MNESMQNEMFVDAPHISLSESDKACQTLTKFYEALGWDSSSQILDPSKVRTSNSIFNELYDIAFDKCPDPVGVGMFMVNTGPSVDADIPDGKVRLLDGWVRPLNQFSVPVVWTMYGRVEVMAESEEEAKKKVKDGKIPLPEGTYLDDSFEVDIDSEIVCIN